MTANLSRLSDSKSGLVFHYTTARAFSEILDRGVIRFGRLQRSNDPLERMLWGFSMAAWGDTGGFAERVENVGSLSRRIHGMCRTLCTSVDGSRQGDYGTYGVVGRGFALAPMWTQYGGKHRGVCLAFDRHRLVRATRMALKAGECVIRHSRIKYSNPPELGDPVFYVELSDGTGPTDVGCLHGHLEEHFDTLLLTKDKAWRHEREFRIVVFLNRGKVPVEVPIETSLVGLVTGSEFPERFGCAIEEARNHYRQIEIGMLNWDQGFPELYPR